MKIKKIVYRDSVCSTGQSNKSVKPSKIEIVGFVIDETEEYITLAQEIIDGKEYFNQISIPKVAIYENKKQR